MSADHNLLRDLASGDPALQLRAVTATLETERLPGEELTLAQRCARLLEEQWREVGDEREAVVHSLARAMADLETRLLVVNVLAYALASGGEDGVTELLTLLRHRDFAIRAYAAEGLGSLDNRGRWAVSALCRAQVRASPGWERAIIIQALGNIGGATATAALQELAADACRAVPRDADTVHLLEAALASALAQS